MVRAGHDETALGLRVWVDRPPHTRTEGYRHMESRSGVLHVERRWVDGRFLFLGLFALVWDGLLATWYAHALDMRLGPAGLCSLAFPMLHVFVGAFLTWYAAAGVFNTTEVRVSGGKLESTHGPIPWAGVQPTAVALEELTRVAIAHERSRWGAPAGALAWQVVGETPAGQLIPLVTQLPREAQARFLANRIQALLPDR